MAQPHRAWGGTGSRVPVPPHLPTSGARSSRAGRIGGASCAAASSRTIPHGDRRCGFPRTPFRRNPPPRIFMRAENPQTPRPATMGVSPAPIGGRAGRSLVAPLTCARNCSQHGPNKYSPTTPLSSAPREGGRAKGGGQLPRMLSLGSSVNRRAEDHRSLPRPNTALGLSLLRGADEARLQHPFCPRLVAAGRVPLTRNHASRVHVLLPQLASR